MRKFDYPTAFQMRRSGLSYRVIAEQMGVKITTSRRACHIEATQRDIRLEYFHAPKKQVAVGRRL